MNIDLINFGGYVAEDEDNLSSYFKKTNTWQGLTEGNLDIILGQKGSGKSASS